MKQLIHNLVTDIKFLFPCIAYEDTFTSEEITITTETYLSKLYPTKMRVEGMSSIGEDYWGRYTFKDDKGQYYCELDGAVYFKGNDQEGEPHYPVKKEIIYETAHIDKDLNEFKAYVDKVKTYTETQDHLELIDVKYSLQEKDKKSDSKVIGHFKFKIKFN